MECCVDDIDIASQPAGQRETESADRAKGATGKDSEATSVLAVEYFCLEPVVGRRAARVNTRLSRPTLTLAYNNTFVCYYS